MLILLSLSHAPRERVSWNFHFTTPQSSYFVTLHVSVWVEMLQRSLHSRCFLSRSTWACELKCCQQGGISDHCMSRSTWACELKSPIYWQFNYTWLVTLHVSVWVEIWDLTICSHFPPVTLHVSVWVEICFRRRKKRTFQVTLHVSVWVEIIHSANLGKSARVTLHVSVWVEMLLLD